MKADARDPVEVLKSELELLESGHYEHLNNVRWRPAFIFEDSPSCLNYETPAERGQCDGCILMQFVPVERRRKKIPCRHIALTTAGETLDSLYRQCELEEVYQAVAEWLRRTISDLERERETCKQSAHHFPSGMGDSPRAIPLYECAEPKCANPDCSSSFHWSAQGELLRFPVGSEEAEMGGIHHVRHYWLCEGCRRVYTLAGDPICGAILRRLWLPPSTERFEETSA